MQPPMQLCSPLARSIVENQSFHTCPSRPSIAPCHCARLLCSPCSPPPDFPVLATPPNTATSTLLRIYALIFHLQLAALPLWASVREVRCSAFTAWTSAFTVWPLGNFVTKQAQHLFRMASNPQAGDRRWLGWHVLFPEPLRRSGDRTSYCWFRFMHPSGERLSRVPIGSCEVIPA